MKSGKLSILFLFIAVMTGCGGGGGSPSPLVSIAVTPANPSVAPGTTQQFNATGTFSNSATLNATSLRLDHTFNQHFRPISPLINIVNGHVFADNVLRKTLNERTCKAFRIL